MAFSKLAVPATCWVWLGVTGGGGTAEEEDEDCCVDDLDDRCLDRLIWSTLVYWLKFESEIWSFEDLEASQALLLFSSAIARFVLDESLYLMRDWKRRSTSIWQNLNYF